MPISIEQTKEALIRSVSALARQRTQGGGWADPGNFPTLGTTGHVLVLLGDLGLGDFPAIEPEIRVLVNAMEGPGAPKYGTYWTSGQVHTFSDTLETMTVSLLCGLALLQHPEIAARHGFDDSKILDSLDTWAELLFDPKLKPGELGGLWERMMFARILERMNAPVRFWNQVEEQVWSWWNEESGLWDYPNESTNKESAHALQILRLCRTGRREVLEALPNRMFERAKHAGDLVFWESDKVDDPVRQSFFVTRWVLISLLDNSQELETAQRDKIAQAFSWLVRALDKEGNWKPSAVEGAGILSADVQAGPGFASYGILAAAKLLSAFGVSQAEISKMCTVELENAGLRKKRNAFVVMPIKEQNKANWELVYEPALKAAGFAPSRADSNEHDRPGVLMNQIKSAITKSDLVLCDISGLNPNVFYEIGFAHALGKPTIVVCDESTKLPFDISHYRAIMFSKESPDWGTKLISSIEIAALMDD